MVNSNAAPDSPISLDISVSERSAHEEEEEEEEGNSPDRIIIKEKKVRLNKRNFHEIVTVIHLEEDEGISAENRVCTICFEEYSNERSYRITPCKHIFHHECIYQWLIANNKKRCPNDNYRFR